MACTPYCIMCSGPAARQCSQCHCGRYCGQDCQRADWPVHKLLCQSFLDFRIPPDDSKRRAILFRAETETPEFIWLTCRMTPFGCEALDEEEVEIIMGSETKEWELVRRNDLRSKILDIPLNIGICGGTEPNKSIIRATEGKAVSQWNGSVLVTGLLYPGGRELYYDLVMSDLRNAVDWFSTFRGYQTRALQVPPNPTEGQSTVG